MDTGMPKPTQTRRAGGLPAAVEPPDENDGEVESPAMEIDTLGGAMGRDFGRFFRDMKMIQKSDVVLLQEPRCSGLKARITIKKLGFHNSMISEANGFSRGIWILWNNPDIKIQAMCIEQQILHVSIQENNFNPWFLSVVYASPRGEERGMLWNSILDIKHKITGDWLLLGDFNDIANDGEKRGGAPVDIAKCINFSARINSCNLMDLGQVGGLFTWRGPIRNGYERVYKKLDRGLCNVGWRTRFPDALVKVLARVHSDHHPLCLITQPNIGNVSSRPFCFQAMWLEHKDFNNFVKDNWCQNSLLVEAIDHFIPKLKEWNKVIFGNLDATLRQEETLWHQKSRKAWITGGDRNIRKNFIDYIRFAWSHPEAIRVINTINTTLLVLIPKMDPPQWASQFLPIVLCNVIYKCITKILAGWIKPLMDTWISPHRAGFFPGRNIQDNIIIA
ncbi:hypothetical protein RIF29_29359 [Crotalaria pallida]|uniref:Endonuclease/exonuclease/phosphatase domain-containing protein n=1 Tax=Crotalaria pallida TaxID=3830 RepID=A0AAN9EGS4_CROPI